MKIQKLIRGVLITAGGGRVGRGVEFFFQKK